MPNQLMKTVLNNDEQEIVFAVGDKCSYISGGKVSTLNNPAPAVIETLLENSVVVRDLIHNGHVEIPYQLCFLERELISFKGALWVLGDVYEFYCDGTWVIGRLSSSCGDGVWFNGGVLASSIRVTKLKIGTETRIAPKVKTLDFKF